MDPIRLDGWALILGASSGFGEAASIELARAGMNIFGVHLDRRATLPNVERVCETIRGLGREAVFFNVNAADEKLRSETLEAIGKRMAGVDCEPPLRLFLHSLAFGTLKPFIAESPREATTAAQLEMTLRVMAHTLVYWTQDLVRRRLIGKGSRVFAMTSAGDVRVLPSYGPVSAAKAALDSHVRQLAVELIPLGISVNAIRAGIADTPALRKIPASEGLKDLAAQRHPAGRLTTPEDVARVLVALARPETDWLTGGVLNVDGGEILI